MIVESIQIESEERGGVLHQMKKVQNRSKLAKILMLYVSVSWRREGLQALWLSQLAV